MMPTAVRDGRTEHVVERLASERVQDDLHRGGAAAGHRGQGLVAGLDAHPVRRDGTLLDQGVEIVVRPVAGQHTRGRAVQLDQVEPVGPQVAPRAVDPAAEVGEGVVLGHLVLATTHLGGHRDRGAGVLGQEPADQLLAPSVAVHVGGVEEGDPALDRGGQHLQRVGLRHRTPVRAELPGAQTHDRDRTFRTTENALLHAGQTRWRGKPRPACGTDRCRRTTTAGSGSRTRSRPSETEAHACGVTATATCAVTASWSLTPTVCLPMVLIGLAISIDRLSTERSAGLLDGRRDVGRGHRTEELAGLAGAYVELDGPGPRAGSGPPARGRCRGSRGRRGSA